MAIPGTTPVSAPLAQTSESDSYGTHEDRRGIGGYVCFETLAERDAHSMDKRKPGMMCAVEEDGRFYTLGSDLTTWTDVAAFSITIPFAFGNGNPEGVRTATNEIYIDVVAAAAGTNPIAYVHVGSSSNTGWRVLA